jgi:hypothetical protein
MHAYYLSHKLYEVSGAFAKLDGRGLQLREVQEVTNMRDYEFSAMRSYLNHVE